MSASPLEISVAEPSLWHCELCGFVYDEAQGLATEGFAPGTLWDSIPENWSCPDCGQPKGDFQPLEIA